MCASDAIDVRDSVEGLTPSRLEGFFVGWPAPPSPRRHLEILEASTLVSVAWRGEQQVAGFITAISDGIFAAYIPLLEVRPEFQGCGIGTALLQRMVRRLRGCYMVDLICEPDLVPFYERAGFVGYSGAIRRDAQALRG